MSKDQLPVSEKPAIASSEWEKTPRTDAAAFRIEPDIIPGSNNLEVVDADVMRQVERELRLSLVSTAQVHPADKSIAELERDEMTAIVQALYDAGHTEAVCAGASVAELVRQVLAAAPQPNTGERAAGSAARPHTDEEHTARPSPTSTGDKGSEGTITVVEVLGHPDKPVAAPCAISGCQFSVRSATGGDKASEALPGPESPLAMYREWADEFCNGKELQRPLMEALLERFIVLADEKMTAGTPISAIEPTNPTNLKLPFSVKFSDEHNTYMLLDADGFPAGMIFGKPWADWIATTMNGRADSRGVPE